ncbi:MAG: 3-oxoacyl-[acyl-carrier-protein] reductase [Actinomycetia bacterium]|nr:3-oxoacyl-[acyl-carrier-protein] reductase [Actinomycetes bacterium]
MQLRGKRIIVTGAAGGIGSAAVRAFLAEGADVVPMDQLAGPGGCLALDVADRASVDTAFTAAIERLGGLDVLVHAAGVDVLAPAATVTDAIWHANMTVNALGTMHTNQRAFPAMRDGGGGAIINLGSDAGLVPTISNGAYAASKAAVHVWTRAIATEWGPFNVRANAVLPVVETPLSRSHRAAMTPEEGAVYDDGMAKRIKLGGCMGDPDEDLAPLLVFLASDGSRFITGQLLAANGGYGMVR